MGVAQLGAELTQEQIEDITAFLRTLTGEVPQLDYPLLPELGPDTPLPEPM
jgi:cytochrome c peroxidase